LALKSIVFEEDMNLVEEDNTWFDLSTINEQPLDILSRCRIEEQYFSRKAKKQNEKKNCS